MPLVSVPATSKLQDLQNVGVFQWFQKKMNTPKVSKSHGSFLQFNQKLSTFPPKTKQTKHKSLAFPGCLRFPSLGFRLSKWRKNPKGWLQPSPFIPPFFPRKTRKIRPPPPRPASSRSLRNSSASFAAKRSAAWTTSEI